MTTQPFEICACGMRSQEMVASNPARKERNINLRSQCLHAHPVLACTAVATSEPTFSLETALAIPISSGDCWKIQFALLGARSSDAHTCRQSELNFSSDEGRHVHIQMPLICVLCKMCVCVCVCVYDLPMLGFISSGYLMSDCLK